MAAPVLRASALRRWPASCRPPAPPPPTRRGLSRFSPAKAQVHATVVREPSCRAPPGPSQAFFDATGVCYGADSGSEAPQDPNKAKLGKTLRILQERLPTLLQSPLPHDILAPNISLHLFPSTHPHLPTVSGRVAYNAALWTSPIAWNRVPIVGNVRIEILAERMTSEPLTFLPRRPGAMPEQLVVRWCERRKSSSTSPEPPSAIARALPFLSDRGADPNTAFTGLFIFDFDSEGRILSHTIEHAQAHGDWEGGMGAKFVGLTDWLLGGMKGSGDSPIPMYERIRRRRHL